MYFVTNSLTFRERYDKMVANATVAHATFGGNNMPSVMRRINVISRCQALYRGERLSGELSESQQVFVICISKNPGMSQEELSRRLCFNKSTVARNVAYLEDMGYLTRITDGSDKRIQRIYPTKKMLDTLPRVKEIAREWNSLITGGISEEELAVFTSVLERMESKARRLLQGEDNE